MGFDDSLFTSAEFCCKDLDMTPVWNQGDSSYCSCFPPLDSIAAAYTYLVREGIMKVPDNNPDLAQHMRTLEQNLPVVFSPQSIIDSVPRLKNEKGYAIEQIFNYAVDQGLYQESDYPFGSQKQPVKQLEEAWRLKIRDFKYISIVDSKDVRHELQQKQRPIVAILTCHLDDLKASGKEEIYQCRSKTENKKIIKPGLHCVLVIGFGKTKKGKPYFIIKNSWGVGGYGLEGYGRVSPETLTHFYMPVGPFYWTRGHPSNERKKRRRRASNGIGKASKRRRKN